MREFRNIKKEDVNRIDKLWKLKKISQKCLKPQDLKKK